jgi:hypothetical protein
MQGVEMVRMTTGIAHGLTLEHLSKNDKIDERLIDTAFASLHVQLPVPPMPGHQQPN